MPSLLLVVFLIELFAHIVNTVGAATVNNLVRVSPSHDNDEVDVTSSRLSRLSRLFPLANDMSVCARVRN